jgi:acetyl-CoA carboxylase biotin carboxylase subunit
MFEKILVANRGEIAIRIIRAAKEMGIRTVAVYSDADRNAPHVFHADEACAIGPSPSTESYLAIERILEAAKASGAEAIHPGYGFLAENPKLPAACEQEGLVFIGPTANAMKAMGDKIYAKRTVGARGVPTVPGTGEPVKDANEALREAEAIGYPVILKAALGGGGKGMRLVRNKHEMKSSYDIAVQEAGSAFGDRTIYLEKFLEKPRHVEFQILGDNGGHVVHLGERECSIQRRHQKLIEESPSTAIDEELRREMGEAACKAAEAVGYTNAGTVEFMFMQDGTYYFLEMNTRLQVEHPVTEMVTGLDLVKLQIRIADGAPITFESTDVARTGSSIECRIYAEDPDNDFLPSCGRIETLREPAGPGVRIESGVYSGYEVPVFYDPLIAKLVTWGRDREEAIARTGRALAEYWITGIHTTIPFHRRAVEDPRFIAGTIDTSFIEEMESRAPQERYREIAAMAGAAYMLTGRDRGRKRTVGRAAAESPWKERGRAEATAGL